MARAQDLDKTPAGTARAQALLKQILEREGWELVALRENGSLAALLTGLLAGTRPVVAKSTLETLNRKVEGLASAERVASTTDRSEALLATWDLLGQIVRELWAQRHDRASADLYRLAVGTPRELLDKILTNYNPWDELPAILALDKLVASGSTAGLRLTPSEMATLRERAKDAKDWSKGVHTPGNELAADKLRVLAANLADQGTGEPRWNEADPSQILMYMFGRDHRVEFHGVVMPAVWVVAPEVAGGKVYLGKQHNSLTGAYHARRLMQLVTRAELGVEPSELRAEWFRDDPASLQRASQQLPHAAVVR